MRSNFVAVCVSLLIVALTLLAIAGCVAPSLPEPGQDSFPWQHRAMAEIAIVSVTAGTPDAKPGPTVGGKCPDCNDPPGACGVGRVGDGRTCSKCNRCDGDGRIDDRDLRSLGDAGESTDPPAKTITLRLSDDAQAWAPQWHAEQKQAVVDDGWTVRVEIEPDGAIAAPYFVVVDGDWSTEFHEPLTPELLQEWTVNE